MYIPVCFSLQASPVVSCGLWLLSVCSWPPERLSSRWPGPWGCPSPWSPAGGFNRETTSLPGSSTTPLVGALQQGLVNFSLSAMRCACSSAIKYIIYYYYLFIFMLKAKYEDSTKMLGKHDEDNLIVIIVVLKPYFGLCFYLGKHINRHWNYIGMAC